MVSFGRLKLVTKIEALVTLVQDAMIKALRSHLARATLHRETKHEGTSVERRVTHDFDRLEWCSDTRLCAQAILLCEQTAWCKAVEMALLTEDHAERELRNLRRNEAGHLMRLLDHLRSSAEPPSPLHRLRLERLVLQQLRSQEALRLLLSTKGRFHREMLPWQMQLRLESPSASVKHLRLRHLEYCADYGFEYQGLSFRMVVTPQTERCWLAITQAFAQGMAPVVCGAAGEGKSQTLKDLAMEQGVFCPLLACSEFTSAADLSRVLVGLAGHSSCWVALEQTEALQPGLLSLLLGLFQRLRSLLVQETSRSSGTSTSKATASSRAAPHWRCSFRAQRLWGRPPKRWG
ncbi:unnamed protein product [Effrenium voratum]|nr:unnamed protein product [Effrenium voratum]